MANNEIKLGKLKQRSEFLYVKDGRYQARPGVVIQMRAQPDPCETINVGFTATKKIGNAVVRNRCKRRMRALARELLPRHGKLGHDYVFIARASTAKAPWPDLHKDVEKALLRLT